MFLIELLHKQFLIFLKPQWFFTIKIILFLIISIINIIRDILFRKVYSKLLFIFLLFFIVITIIFDKDSILSVILGVLSTTTIFLLIYFLSKGGIGFGDMFYIAFFSSGFGIVFGIIALILSFWIACLFVIVLLILKKINKSTKIPLIPFLFLGCLCSLCFGFIIQ